MVFTSSTWTRITGVLCFRNGPTGLHISTWSFFPSCVYMSPFFALFYVSVRKVFPSQVDNFSLVLRVPSCDCRAANAFCVVANCLLLYKIIKVHNLCISYIAFWHISLCRESARKRKGVSSPYSLAAHMYISRLPLLFILHMQRRWVGRSSKVDQSSS